MYSVCRVEERERERKEIDTKFIQRTLAGVEINDNVVPKAAT